MPSMPVHWVEPRERTGHAIWSHWLTLVQLADNSANMQFAGSASPGETLHTNSNNSVSQQLIMPQVAMEREWIYRITEKQLLYVYPFTESTIFRNFNKTGKKIKELTVYGPIPPYTIVTVFPTVFELEVVVTSRKPAFTYACAFT